MTPPSCSGICPKRTSVEAASQITPISKRLISGNVLLWPLCPVSQRSRPSSNFCIFSSMIKQINGILSPECELHTKTNYCFDDLFMTQAFISHRPISKRLISGNVLLWPLCPISQRSRPSSNFCIFSSMIKQINGILSPECELHTKTNYCFDDLITTQLFISYRRHGFCLH